MALSIGTRVSVTAPFGGVFVYGTLSQLREGIATVDLDWDLADGAPARLHTSAASVTPVKLAPGHDVEVNASNGGRFCVGRVAGFPRDGMVKLDLEWDLADGKPASLVTDVSLVKPVKGTEISSAKRAQREARKAAFQERMKQRRALAGFLVRELEQKMALCASGSASDDDGAPAKPINPSPRQAAAFLRRIADAVKTMMPHPTTGMKKHVLESFARVGWSFAAGRGMPSVKTAPGAGDITLLLMDLLEATKK